MDVLRGRSRAIKAAQATESSSQGYNHSVSSSIYSSSIEFLSSIDSNLSTNDELNAAAAHGFNNYDSSKVEATEPSSQDSDWGGTEWDLDQGSQLAQKPLQSSEQDLLFLDQPGTDQLSSNKSTFVSSLSQPIISNSWKTQNKNNYQANRQISFQKQSYQDSAELSSYNSTSLITPGYSLSRAPSQISLKPRSYFRQPSGNSMEGSSQHEPTVLLTPPLLSKKRFESDSSNTNKVQMEQSLNEVFDGFDGVHITDGSADVSFDFENSSRTVPAKANATAEPSSNTPDNESANIGKQSLKLDLSLDNHEDFLGMSNLGVQKETNNHSQGQGTEPEYPEQDSLETPFTPGPYTPTEPLNFEYKNNKLVSKDSAQSSEIAPGHVSSSDNSFESSSFEIIEPPFVPKASEHTITMVSDSVSTDTDFALPSERSSLHIQRPTSTAVDLDPVLDSAITASTEPNRSHGIFREDLSEVSIQVNPSTLGHLNDQQRDHKPSSSSDGDEVKLYHPKPQRIVTSPLSTHPDESINYMLSSKTSSSDLDQKPRDDENDGMARQLPFEPISSFNPMPNVVHDSVALHPRPSSRGTRSVLNHDENAIYYPAPIPVQLRLPPLLSKKRREPQMGAPGNGVELPRGKPPAHRRRSFVLTQFERPPTWHVNPVEGTSIKEPSIYPQEDQDHKSNRSLTPDSLIDSDRATIESDEEYQEEELDDDEGGNKKKSGRKSAKNNSNDDGEDDNSEFHFNMQEQDDDIGLLQDDGNIAFSGNLSAPLSSLNFGPGVIPGEGARPTSLIEELELRKAGRKAAQSQKVLYSQRGYAMASATGKDDVESISTQMVNSGHPLDNRRSVTLLELQHVANRDYEAKIKMMQQYLDSQNPPKRLNKADDVGDEETLGARRARLKREKEAAAADKEETLAERKARLRASKAVGLAA